eukprot:SAG11_NODE_2065_length_3869_cov_1.739523_1_plen_302_part_00
MFILSSNTPAPLLKKKIVGCSRTCGLLLGATVAWRSKQRCTRVAMMEWSQSLDFKPHHFQQQIGMGVSRVSSMLFFVSLAAQGLAADTLSHAVLADAAKLHIAATRPRITKEIIQSIPAPDITKMSRSFDQQRKGLIQEMRGKVTAQTIAEEEDRHAAQDEHIIAAMKTLNGHSFKHGGPPHPCPSHCPPCAPHPLFPSISSSFICWLKKSKRESIFLAVKLLRGQEDLYSDVILDKNVWLVAFVNGERGARSYTVHLCCSCAKSVLNLSTPRWRRTANNRQGCEKSRRIGQDSRDRIHDG